jgi:hypothetical protein
MREYIEQGDTLVIKTTYDAEPALKQAEEARRMGKVQIGSKGQELTLACVIPLEHIEAVKNSGHGDLLSPDPTEYRRALVYIQQNQQAFMATDKKVFANHRPKWQ